MEISKKTYQNLTQITIKKYNMQTIAKILLFTSYAAITVGFIALVIQMTKEKLKK